MQGCSLSKSQQAQHETGSLAFSCLHFQQLWQHTQGETGKGYAQQLKTMHSSAAAATVDETACAQQPPSPCHV
jgi:hypothetical protein